MRDEMWGYVRRKGKGWYLDFYMGNWMNSFLIIERGKYSEGLGLGYRELYFVCVRECVYIFIYIYRIEGEKRYLG